jgi:hypothetical protein
MESLDRATATVQLGGKDDFGTQKMKGQPGKTREPPSKFHGFILVHLYFILLSILMVKNSDIMWHHLVDPQQSVLWQPHLERPRSAVLNTDHCPRHKST